MAKAKPMRLNVLQPVRRRRSRRLFRRRRAMVIDLRGLHPAMTKLGGVIRG
jgi:hypothetical protein